MWWRPLRHASKRGLAPTPLSGVSVALLNIGTYL
jgi:hypothetical protein